MQYANMYGWSDVEPFEVVRVISDKTLEVREMDGERDESVKLEFHVGGFSAHCSNSRPSSSPCRCSCAAAPSCATFI